jgi:hypothetical protein
MIKRYGNHGLAYSGENAVVSFEIIKHADQQSIEAEKASMNTIYVYADVFKLVDYNVAAYGKYNNVPEDLRELVKNNHLLPEILNKQVRYMYGQGPELFEEKIEGNKKTRVPIAKDQYPQVWAWLNSWDSNGLADDVRTYLKRVIREYYYTEGIFTKWAFNRSRRTGGAIPVRGLEYMPTTRTRLGTRKQLDLRDPLEDESLDLVLYGLWYRGTNADLKEFPRFDRANPFKNHVAVNYTRDFGFGEEVYSFPSFYYGLKEWIAGSNLNPKYINSYLKNSLSAKLHVLIPNAWIEQKVNTLKEICEQNQSRDEAGKDLITEYDGLTDIGKEFNFGMVNQLIDIKMEALSGMLSGSGENQGKTFVSRKFQTEFGTEEWEFKDIPVKYAEFVKSIIDFDKRAVEVILAGKGLDPSISNVTKDGIFSASGSGAYYNYLIYLNSLSYAEEFITNDINMALRLNFPQLAAKNIVLGFMRNMPERQEELAPKDRLTATTENK